MKITSVRITKIEPKESTNKLVAVASIVVDDEVAIHGIKIINGEKGLFIAMPSKRNNDGTYSDIVHPINSSAREVIQSVILDEYETIKEA